MPPRAYPGAYLESGRSIPESERDASTETLVRRAGETYNSPVPTALDNGRRSPRKLLRAVVARLLGRKP